MFISTALSIVFFTIAILNPAFYPPWSGFISEYLFFLAFIFLLPLFGRIGLSAPKVSAFFLVISIIPLVQYLFGQIIYLDTALLSFIYLLFFWLAVLVGYSSIHNYRHSLDYFFGTFLACGLLSCGIAFLQWVSIYVSPDWMMAAQSRPFANMAQPNHLATFLIIGLMGVLYFYSIQRINKFVLLLSSLVLLTGIAMTQSRTAWVALLFLYGLFSLSFYYNKTTLSIKKQTGLLIYFVTCALFLPVIRKNLIGVTGRTAIERASSGHERIQIWQQAIDAISQRPLCGYGWNQGSFAQFDTVKEGYLTHYLTSFHNIILDILIWCGIPIGIGIIIVSAFFYFKLLFAAKNTVQLCLIGAVSAVLIHALLEYPLSYAYFLLPVGYMLGCLFAFDKSLSKEIVIKDRYVLIVWLISTVSMIYVFIEYSHIPDNMVAAETHEMNERRDAVSLPYRSYLFERFDQRARWIAQYPCMKLSPSQMIDAENMTKSYLIFYDLEKFAKVLYFNNKQEQAQSILKKFNYMYDKQYTLDDLNCNGIGEIVEH